MKNNPTPSRACHRASRARAASFENVELGIFVTVQRPHVDITLVNPEFFKNLTTTFQVIRTLSFKFMRKMWYRKFCNQRPTFML